jgi:hypothetical protein
VDSIRSQYYRKINKVNTQTDFDGKFTIKANAKQIIMASYIGMSSVEMPAASSMIFKLSEAANELESVVVGYGTLSKKINRQYRPCYSEDIEQIGC